MFQHNETGDQQEWYMSREGKWQRIGRVRIRGGKRRLEHDARHEEIHGKKQRRGDGGDGCPLFHSSCVSAHAVRSVDVCTVSLTKVGGLVF